jgi:hypothetical protein
MKRTALVILGIVAATAAIPAQTAFRAARTEAGQPDLQGVWNFSTDVPLQRPVANAKQTVLTREEAEARRTTFRNAINAIGLIAPVEAIGFEWFDLKPAVEDLRSSMITYPANGRLPALVQGVRRMPGLDDFIGFLGNLKPGQPPPPALANALATFTGGKKDSYTDFTLVERCILPTDPPFVPLFDDNVVQIIQSHDHVVFVNDYLRRVVRLGGAPLGETFRSHAGIATGRWEGETLVIETRNFSEGRPSFGGIFTSREKVVTERITRMSPTRIDYRATVVDPRSFQDRVELSYTMALADVRIHEGSCHEGNYSMRHSLGAARLADGAAKK